MNVYEVIGRVVGFAAGRVKLTPAQSSPREHALKDLGGGTFEVVRSVEFKKGETFEYDGEFGKGAAKSVSQLNAADPMKPTSGKGKK